MDVYEPYVIPLFALCGLALTGTRPMIRTAAALLGNWLANTLFVWASGTYDPWAFFMLTDAAAGAVILYQPARRVQAIIGWTFMAQIIMHVIYSISPNSVAQFAYWQMLTWIAFVQLVLLGGWIGGHWVRRYTARRAASRDPHSNERPGLAP